MADLDEMSMLLGEISADTRHVREWCKEHETRDQHRYDLLAARLDASSGHGARIQKIEDEIVIVMPVVQSLKRFKWVAGGFVMALTLVGGAAGGAAAQVLKWFG